MGSHLDVLRCRAAWMPCCLIHKPGYEYAVFPGQPVALRDSSAGVRYLYGDHQGSVSIATNASGVVVSNQHVDPWGKVRTGNVSATRRGFTGQYLDESGVMYCNAR